MENGNQELESNRTEQQKASEKIGSGRSTAGTVDENKVTENENIEKRFILVKESLDRPEEPSQGGISQNIGLDDLEFTVENLKTLPVAENQQIPSQNGLMNASVNSGKSERTGEANGSVQIETEGIGSSKQESKRNTRLKVPVTNSWSLRSKSQEKAKAPEPSDPVKEGSTDWEKKRKRRKKKQMKNDTVNEFSRIPRHTRYLLQRIKFEQSLIDAYSAEGWKGQSLEKLKPEKELQRAKSHIIRYKLRIRELFQRIDQSLAVGKLPASLFDSQGEIDSEDIFCAKCGSKDLTLDNDIILCDGVCERGFHQFCLNPPLLKKDIPPGDEGWLCPACDCKVDCIHILKDFQGTKISLTDGWEKIFPEAAAAASGKNLNDGSGSSDDSEDDDYDPDKPDNDEKVGEDEASSDEPSHCSASDDLAANNEKCVELPSDESGDDDFDPSAPDEDKEEKQDGSSSDFTSDSEDLGALLEDAISPDENSEHILPSSYQEQPSMITKEEHSHLGVMKRQSLKDEISYLMKTAGEPVSGRRHVERLDFKKLNDETYGNSASDSSDEDYDDTAPQKRRANTNRENAAAESPNEIPVTKGMSGPRDETQKEDKTSSRRARKCNADVTAKQLEKGSSSTANAKKSTPNRLGEARTQRLLESFNQNQYPARAVKEKLAEELGLKIQQVTKWFENVRWSFRHKPQIEPISIVKNPEPQLNTSTGSSCSNQHVKPQVASVNAAENHTSGVRVEHSVTITNGGNSRTPKSKKRKGKSNHVPCNVTDTQSPRLRSSTKRTRRNSSVV